jgi:2-C-methyl-D-erythritol 4-phosphate cytidylyltransferase
VEAHRRAEEAGDTAATDDASLVQRYLDIEVAVVPGESDNLKITAASDLAIAEALLHRRLGG